MPVDPGGSVPLHVHARYSLAEILAAFGVPNPAASRGSCVKWIEDAQADVFWFNLRKTEKHFSPTTMYADRAISPTLFQWESQSATSEASPTGQRYVNHRERGSSVHLFFRESKDADGDLGAPAYLYAGQPRTSVTRVSGRCGSSGNSTTSCQPMSSTTHAWPRPRCVPGTPPRRARGGMHMTSWSVPSCTTEYHAAV